jgi:pimeloyl-ACP methyl ester carboxylesterase
MEELGIDKSDFIGHSLGAIICTAFSARYPELVRKLVLVDAGGLGKMSFNGRIMLSIFRITDHWMGKKRGPEYLVRPIEELQVLDDLPKIKAPTLIIWGQNDFYLPLSHAKLANSLIPLSQLCVFSNCGHAPQREYSVKFNNLINKFLGSET